MKRGTNARRRRRRTGFVLAASMGLFAAGCGGSNRTTQATAPAPQRTRSVAQPSGSPIDVAVLYARTGSSADNFKGVGAVAQAWANDVNRSDGGIAGHPVHVQLIDTKSDSATSLTSAQSVIAKKSTVAAVWADANDEDIGASKLAASGVPLIGSAEDGSVDIWGAKPDAFTTSIYLPQIQYAIAQTAKDTGKKNLSLIYCAEAPVCQDETGPIKKGASAVGLRFSPGLGISASSSNYVAQCLSLMHEGADSVVVGVVGSVFTRVASDCALQGYRGSWEIVGSAVNQAALDTVSKDNVQGALGGFPWWVNAAPVNRFRQVMAANHVSVGDYADDASTSTWASLELFRTALDHAKSSLTATVTRQDVLRAYGQVKNETLGGLLAQPITLTAGQPEAPLRCFFAYTDNQGKLVAVPGGLTPTCLPPGV